jgi:mannose-1-phosphate guanylyltransferase
LLHSAEKLIREDRADILFIGETPRFANENLGWIGLGPEGGYVDDIPFFQFESLTYRPELKKCIEIFEAGTHVWNTGFFVTTPAYIRQLYQRFSPQMWDQLQVIEKSIGTEEYNVVLEQIYPHMPTISFDDAILTHLDHERALVLHSEMGWSDPGTLYALKESLNPDPEANVTKGLVIDTASKDSLIYNYEAEKLVVVIGVEGMIVVNTPDAMLVVHKDNIPLVKKVISGLQDTELEAYS